MCSKTSIGAIVLFVIGLFFLGRNLGWISDSTGLLKTWWPVILIVLSGFLLWRKRTPRT